MSERSGLGLRGKTTFSLTLLLLAGMLAVVFFGYYQSKTIAEQKAIELQQSELLLLENDVKSSLQEHANILLSLRDVPPVQAILRALENQGVDPQSRDSLDEWRTRLAVIFSTFLKHHNQYLQVRYIHKNGQELVRVDLKDNQLYVVPESELQNKSRRNYVAETLQLELGELYFSKVDLNRERGEIEIPHTPVLRLATPVYGATGEVEGVMVINLTTERFFSRMVTHNADAVMVMADEEGNYIVHPDSGKTFSHDLGTGFNLYKDYPNLAGLIASHDAFFINDTEKQMLEGFRKIFYAPTDSSRYWILVVVVPEDVLFADVKEGLNSMLFVSGFVAILSLIYILWFVTNRIVNPVETLAEAALKMQHGDLSVRVDKSKVKDELAVLFDAINGYAENQQSATQILEREIAAKTTRLSTVIDNIVDGIVTITKEGMIESFNPSAETIFGYRKDEVIGSNVSVLMPDNDRSQHDEYVQNYIKTGVAKIIGVGREVVGLRKDGSQFPMDLQIREIRIDDQLMFLGIVRDISERKRIQIMQREFISTVSHELRTPLTSINGSLGLVLGGVTGELSEKALTLLNIASSNCERLILLINDILDIEKLEAGRMRFDFIETDLLPVVQRAIDDNRAYAEKFDVELRLHVDDEQPAMVEVDTKRMAQVMSNLLSNAAKFSPANETVDVYVDRHTYYVRIAVHDKGKGIPESFKDRIFGKFCQADSSDSRRNEGTGLGLNITRGIVKQHGGKIYFDSDEETGTTFYVELPLSKSASKKDDSEQKVKNEGPLMLIVDDDQDISKLLIQIVNEEGYRYHQAFNCDDAARLVSNNRYDAIVIDLHVQSSQGGLALLNDLQTDSTTKDIPVIVVSSTNQEGIKDINGMALNTTEWIEKPIDPKKLMAVVHGLPGKKRKNINILHVEDDPDIASIISSLLGDSYSLKNTHSLAGAKQLFKEHNFDLVLLDIGLEDGSGLDLLPLIQKLDHQPAVVIFSVHDVDDEIIEQVDSVLVKSQTDNQSLKQQIRSAMMKNRKTQSET